MKEALQNVYLCGNWMTDRRHTSMYADKEKSIVLNMYKFVIIDAHTFLDTQTFYTLS